MQTKVYRCTAYLAQKLKALSENFIFTKNINFVLLLLHILGVGLVSASAWLSFVNKTITNYSLNLILNFSYSLQYGSEELDKA